MGVSVYYSANRDSQLTDKEQSDVKLIIDKYNKAFEYSDEAETFSLYDYDVDEPNEILSGSTKLPSSLEDIEAIMYTIDHWLGCLTELRKHIDSAIWQVHIDDSDATWNGNKWVMESE